MNINYSFLLYQMVSFFKQFSVWQNTKISIDRSFWVLEVLYRLSPRLVLRLFFNFFGLNVAAIHMCSINKLITLMTSLWQTRVAIWIIGKDGGKAALGFNLNNLLNICELEPLKGRYHLRKLLFTWTYHVLVCSRQFCCNNFIL